MNKISKTIYVLFMFMILFSVSVSAWTPEKSFYCEVEEQKIPEGTAYVDLLLPIKETDECYIEYNEKNGEKFAIAKDSEIVKYNEDGYKSYTFHVVDADSKMTASHHYTFSVSKAEYEKYKDLLEDFKFYCDIDVNADRYYSVNIATDSDLNQKIKNLQEKTDIVIYVQSFYIEFNDGYEHETEYDFDYMRTKYKFAKIAYLDMDGNILGVTNKVKINSHKHTGVHLNLKLSGLSLTADATTGPPVYLIFVIPAALILFAVIGLIIGLAVALKRRIKKQINLSFCLMIILK